MASGEPSAALSLPAGDDGPTTRFKKRILVADDSRDTADSLATMLRLAGHEVHTAHDGQETVEAAGWFRPDVALLDIGMPKRNGYEAARCIREGAWGKNVFLVAITGWGQPQDVERSRDAGFDRHLVKPVEIPTLQALLDEVKPRRAVAPQQPGTAIGGK